MTRWSVRSTAALLACLVVGGVAPGFASAGPADSPSTSVAADSTSTDSPPLRTPEEARKIDTALVSEATGLSTAEIDQLDAIQSQWDDVLRPFEVGGANSAFYVGTKLPATPTDPVQVYWKGPLPNKLSEAIRASNLNVRVFDNQPLSDTEMTNAQGLIWPILTELGYVSGTSYVDLTDEGARLVVFVSNVDKKGEPLSNGELNTVLREKLPESLFKIISIESDGVIEAHPLATVRGGQKLYQDPDTSVFCTTSFGVLHETGASGVGSAGHCTPANRVDANGVIETVNAGGSHQGYWGDVAWFTSAQNSSDFFDTATHTREVYDVQAAWEVATNERVCQFGRGTGFARCDNLYSGDATCVYDGVAHYNMALTTQGQSFATYGDSGGPVYYNNLAIGSIGGYCTVGGNYRIGLSKVDRYDEAMAVKVRARAKVIRAQTLQPGQTAYSYSGLVKLVMQFDGNLVKYKSTNGSNWAASWSSGTFVGNSRAAMQGDGNFVVYTPGNTAVWQSGTNTTNSEVVVQNDGNVVVRNNNGVVGWSTGP